MDFFDPHDASRYDTFLRLALLGSHTLLCCAENLGLELSWAILWLFNIAMGNGP
jgi:hypothetical protein